MDIKGFSVWMETGIFIIDDHVYTDNSGKRIYLTPFCFSYLKENLF